MAQGHMPSIQIEHIVNAGYTTIALLAHGVHDESKMEEFVEHLSLVPDGESFQTFPPQLASIYPTSSQRMHCQRWWSGRVKALRTEFCQNYPGELLTPATMPSISFEQTFLEHCRPRNDRQLLRSLLADGADGESALSEQPEAVVNHQAPVEVVVTKFQSLLTVALAMLSQAHLIVVKRFHAKFLELALAKPRDQHLRSPSLSEILDADRAAWTAVIEPFYYYVTMIQNGHSTTS